jgi:hypothetical protein
MIDPFVYIWNIFFLENVGAEVHLIHATSRERAQRGAEVHLIVESIKPDYRFEHFNPA